jgi:hypothetical protein
MSFPSVVMSPTIARPKLEPGLPMSTTVTFIALRRSQLGHFREELWLPIALAYVTLAGSPPQASICGYLLWVWRCLVPPDTWQRGCGQIGVFLTSSLLSDHFLLPADFYRTAALKMNSYPSPNFSQLAVALITACVLAGFATYSNANSSRCEADVG